MTASSSHLSSTGGKHPEPGSMTHEDLDRVMSMKTWQGELNASVFNLTGMYVVHVKNSRAFLHARGKLVEIRFCDRQGLSALNMSFQVRMTRASGIVSILPANNLQSEGSEFAVQRLVK